MAVLDEAGLRFGGLFWIPRRREGLLSGKELAPALDVVQVPEEKLERLGVVLDVEEIVHELV